MFGRQWPGDSFARMDLKVHAKKVAGITVCGRCSVTGFTLRMTEYNSAITCQSCLNILKSRGVVTDDSMPLYVEVGDLWMKSRI